jgi:ribonucleotide monophosphatase NagD (HAD superfamily)
LLLRILFDMDGVLYNSGTAIEGVAETLKWVRAQRIPHLFVTNTSSRGRDVPIEKLARFGVPASKNEILTPAAAAAQWLRRHASGARYVVIGDLGETWDFRTLNARSGCCTRIRSRMG